MPAEHAGDRGQATPVATYRELRAHLEANSTANWFRFVNDYKTTDKFSRKNVSAYAVWAKLVKAGDEKACQLNNRILAFLLTR